MPLGGVVASKSWTLEVFGGGVTETLDRVLEGWFMILPQDACRDPGGGQILTTTRVNPYLLLLFA